MLAVLAENIVILQTVCNLKLTQKMIINGVSIQPFLLFDND